MQERSQELLQETLKTDTFSKGAEYKSNMPKSVVVLSIQEKKNQEINLTYIKNNNNKNSNNQKKKKPWIKENKRRKPLQ